MIKISKYSSDNELFNRIISRAENSDVEVWQAVADIVSDVRKQGDSALFKYAKEFDKFSLTPENIRVSVDEISAAAREVDEKFISAVTLAAENIREFHKYQKRTSYVHDDGDGVRLAKRVLPVDSAGVYCPAGTAPLFSSVLMNVIPAQVAGVERIAAVTPPDQNGRIDPHILATASILGITEIYRIGSAWSIAALAYGTESVPGVAKIAGPGNIYVATAKKMVYGAVGIDSIAGPSEVVVICDKTANAKYVAADLLSQVEHGTGIESGVVLTDCEEFAEKVQDEVDRQLSALDRREAIEKSLANYGGIFLVADMAEAVSVSNMIAPEHLEIQTADPEELSMDVTNAGAVFLGPYSTEPVGDYFCGTNHVLPTGGAARFSSSLSVYDFLKDISVVNYSKERLAQTGRHIAYMADIEGLSAHANAVRVRLEDI
ncbi:MAG: histidinol dehydrogenase [Planctomycetota bacterium]